jgi:hypothetical protein
MLSRSRIHDLPGGEIGVRPPPRGRTPIADAARMRVTIHATAAARRRRTKAIPAAERPPIRRS